jgi:hypothetical protein
MTTIPENTVTQEDLSQWYQLQEQLKKLKAAEMLLRMKIFKGMIKDPKEGTNTVPLAEGWVLKGKHVINRDVDQAALAVNTAVDPATHMSRLSANGIHVEQLIKWKPELITKTYRTLTAEQQQIFDECLIIKEGSPQLEIMLPASEKKKQAGTDPE